MTEFPERRKDTKQSGTLVCVHASECVLRQAQCAVREQNEGTGLRRLNFAEYSVLCQIGKASSHEAPNAASSSPSYVVSTVSSLTHNGRLWQHRSRSPQVYDLNWKSANKTSHTSHIGPRETNRLPQARHRRRSYPDPARPWEVHYPTLATETGRLQ